MRCLLLTTALIAGPAIAADAPPDHDPKSSEIIVTAPFQRDRTDILSGTSVLTGAALTRDLRPTIGETLARQPGVSATSFGPNASRPVLRGFQGERVRVLKDGIGSSDVSNTSVDHAVVINPLTADRIEVLRGPAALLYGSSAIGGVVNVIDSRIPRLVPDGVHVDGIATYGSAAEERSVSGKLDVPLGEFVFHVDGSYSKSSDLRIGGFTLSPALRAQASASADPAIAALATLHDRLPNTAARTWEVAGGAAYVGVNGNIGLSFGHYDSLYGVPIRYSLDSAIEAERVRLQVRQDRADLRGEILIDSGFFEAIKLRAGFADYRHQEIDEAGNIGTTFLSKSIESRIEVVQRKRGVWQGAWGMQLAIRDFNVVGDEAFVPKNTTTQFGVFTLDTFDWGKTKAEIGLRYEKTDLKADASATIGNPFYRRSFDAFSGSLGASYALLPGIRVGLNATHTERAPAAEELFANGPHAGTQAFEIGNPDFRKETSNGVEATLRGAGVGWSFGLSAYANWFSNFIYEQPTGTVEGDLPVFQFLQRSARFWGFEAEASIRVADFGPVVINVDGVADYTRASLSGGSAIPRIPPLRLLGGIEAQTDAIAGRVEIEWSDAQNRIASFETPTRSFTLFNASVAFHPLGRENPTSVVLSANNIFDVEARRHASFLKDYAPLSGRDVRVSARFSF
jgi:iron complex outermembrane recepter protein